MSARSVLAGGNVLTAWQRYRYPPFEGYVDEGSHWKPIRNARMALKVEVVRRDPAGVGETSNQIICPTSESPANSAGLPDDLRIGGYTGG